MFGYVVSCMMSQRTLLLISIIIIGLLHRGMGCLAIAADHRGSPPGTDEFSRRVAANAVLSSNLSELSAAGQDAFRRIGEKCADLKRIPSRAEFVEELQSQESLTRDEFAAISQMFRQVQRPAVTAAKLISVVQGWNRTIQTVDLTYEVTTTGGVRDGATSVNRFVMDGALLFREQTDRFSAGGQKNSRRSKISDDGVLYRSAQGAGAEVSDWDSGEGVFGRIQPRGLRSQFCDPKNPLILQGLIKTTNRFEIYGEAFEGLVGDSTIYESTERINGMECLVVDGASRCYYLSIRHGFAIAAVRMERFKSRNLDGRVVSNKNSNELNSKLFFQPVEGLWIPRRMTIKSGDATRSVTTEISITSCRVNGKIEPTVFTDVIPEGAQVVDTVRRKPLQVQKQAREDAKPAIVP